MFYMCKMSNKNYKLVILTILAVLVLIVRAVVVSRLYELQWNV